MIRAEAMRALIPPPRLRLSEWIEANIRLPGGVSAQPGDVRLWQFQREIADVIGDPLVERVTLVKPVRVGFTTLLTSAVAHFVANDPSPILYLLPTEADCRDYVVSDLEPIFAASDVVASALAEDKDEAERNTLMSRRFPGGSLKVVAAKAPRNLRRHNVRALLIDEADGMEATAEGSPIMLAERRTLSFPNRKLVIGSTPVFEETSHVLRAWAQSDQRVFEVPCPECGEAAEVEWSHIRWPEGRPDEAAWCCPGCGAVVPERRKPAMVAAGKWRALRPDVKGHAGFRLSALVSLHENASWAKLATEWLAVKDDPTTLQTFVNTILGQGWRGAGEELSEADLAARAEPFGLGAVPADVLAVTAGVDVQHDRIEATLVGWTEGGQSAVLGHRVIWGEFSDGETWRELDDLLRQTFPHALGGRIGVTATAVDASDGATMPAVTRFCGVRRKVMPIKGASGFARPVIEKASRKAKSRLWIVGVDTIKQQLFARLPKVGFVRFSADLPPVWYEQLASERAVIRYSRGQPTRSFERVPGRRAEALDCMVYATAARAVISPDWPRLRAEVAGTPPVRPAPQSGGQAGWLGITGNWI